MALVDPPVDKLADKAGNKYALSVVIAKRAKELAVSRADFFNENRDQTPLSVAAKEFSNGQIVINKY